MLTQISIFAENQKGAMRKLLNCLAGAGINVLASVTNDSAEYGIVRMLVSDPALACRVLGEAGYLCRTTPVLGVALADEPGSLAALTEVLEDMNVNVDYIYSCSSRSDGRPVVLLHTEYLQEVEESLRGRGFRLQDETFA